MGSARPEKQEPPGHGLIVPPARGRPLRGGNAGCARPPPAFDRSPRRGARAQRRRTAGAVVARAGARDRGSGRRLRHRRRAAPVRAPSGGPSTTSSSTTSRTSPRPPPACGPPAAGAASGRRGWPWASPCCCRWWATCCGPSSTSRWTPAVPVGRGRLLPRVLRAALRRAGPAHPGPGATFPPQHVAGRHHRRARRPAVRRGVMLGPYPTLARATRRWRPATGGPRHRRRPAWLFSWRWRPSWGCGCDRTLVLTMAAASVLQPAPRRHRVVRPADAEPVRLGGPLELGWLVSVVLTALAASGARERPVPAVDGAGGTRIGWRVLAVPLVCNGDQPGRARPRLDYRMPAVVGMVAIACVLAGIARVAVTFREVRNFHEVTREARTDELTGLANRRPCCEQADGILACGAHRAAGGTAAHGPRRVQGGQRQPRSWGRRPPAAPRRPAACERPSTLTRCWPGSAVTSSPRCCAAWPRTRPWQRPNSCGPRCSCRSGPAGHGDRRRLASAWRLASGRGATSPGLLHCRRPRDVPGEGARLGVSLTRTTPTCSPDRTSPWPSCAPRSQNASWSLHFQPQPDLRTGLLVGAEALVRWQHPQRGLLGPDQFVGDAERPA